MSIPTSFQLMSETYQVVSKAPNQVIEQGGNTISIPEEVYNKELYFYRELTKLIVSVLDIDTDSFSEKTVNLFGGLLCQFYLSKERTDDIIPFTFTLFGTRINVVTDDNLHLKGFGGLPVGQIGIAHYHENLIILQTSKEFFPIGKQTIEQTFFHELTHHIFHAINSELFDDEEIVDNIGSCLHQFETSKTF